MKRKSHAGITSMTLPIFVVDSSSPTGAGLGSIVFGSSGLVGEYRRQGASSWTTMTLGTATLGTWTSAGWIADGSLAGAYEVGIPDAAVAAGARWVAIRYYGVTNMKPVLIEIELDAVDYQDAVHFGISGIPNAAANANGGLPILSVSGTQLAYGVTLADGVAHGGTPGSSTATLALQLAEINNSSGSALRLIADATSFGRALQMTGYMGIDIVTLSSAISARTTGNGEQAVSFVANDGEAFYISGGRLDSSGAALAIIAVAGPAVVIDTDGGAGSYDIVLNGTGQLWDGENSRPVSVNLSSDTLTSLLISFFITDTTKVYSDAVDGSVVKEIASNASGGGGGTDVNVLTIESVDATTAIGNVVDDRLAVYGVSTFSGGAVASVTSISSGAITADSFAAGAIDSAAVNSDALDSITIESGINLPQAMAIDLAASAGQSTGVDTGSPAVYKAAGNPGTTRITTTASAGNRTSVTLNLP